MGIPGFNVWFSNQHKDAYLPLSRVRVDHLYIDMNSVLHNVMRQAKSRQQFHKLLHQRLNGILDVTSPVKSVMLAVDGPAPLAKLLTQRDRRKTSKPSKMSTDEQLSGSSITPGTSFMCDLSLSLMYFVCCRVAMHRSRGVAFELSDATVMGEGEVKILGRLIRHWYEPLGGEDTHVIVGDDADLILMAMVSPTEHLYVANASLQREGITRSTPIFSVDALHAVWLKAQLLQPTTLQALGQLPSLMGMKMDMALIAVLCSGNDYLPGMKSMSMIDSGYGSGVWSRYLKLRRTSAEHGSRSLVALNADNQPYLDLGMMVELLVGGGASLAHEADADSEWNGRKSSPSAQQYLHGVMWMMQMYLTGECPDYRYNYDGGAPSPSQLAALCASMPEQHVTFADFAVSEGGAQPLLPFVCALALLPAKCSPLLPKAVQPLMGQGSPVADIFHECQTCNTLTKERSTANKVGTACPCLVCARTPRRCLAGLRMPSDWADAPPSSTLPVLQAFLVAKVLKEGLEEEWAAAAKLDPTAARTLVSLAAPTRPKAPTPRGPAGKRIKTAGAVSPTAAAATTVTPDSGSDSADGADPNELVLDLDEGGDDEPSAAAAAAAGTQVPAAAGSAAGGSSSSSSLGVLLQRLIKAESAYYSTKDDVRLQGNAKMSHDAKEHPYAPFPIGRLADAAGALSPASFLSAEQGLVTFGMPSVYSSSPHVRRHPPAAVRPPLVPLSATGQQVRSYSQAGSGLAVAAGASPPGRHAPFIPPPTPLDYANSSSMPMYKQHIVEGRDGSVELQPDSGINGSWNFEYLLMHAPNSGAAGGGSNSHNARPRTTAFPNSKPYQPQQQRPYTAGGGSYGNRTGTAAGPPPPSPAGRNAPASVSQPPASATFPNSRAPPPTPAAPPPLTAAAAPLPLTAVPRSIALQQQQPRQQPRQPPQQQQQQYRQPAPPSQPPPPQPTASLLQSAGRPRGPQQPQWQQQQQQPGATFQRSPPVEQGNGSSQPFPGQPRTLVPPPQPPQGHPAAAANASRGAGVGAAGYGHPVNGHSAFGNGNGYSQHPAAHHQPAAPPPYNSYGQPYTGHSQPAAGYSQPTANYSHAAHRYSQGQAGAGAIRPQQAVPQPKAIDRSAGVVGPAAHAHLHF
ncbi:MAG: hypothetical protein WDW36_005067 [Sanguina aurantia]